jgi:hypothetical protein
MGNYKEIEGDLFEEIFSENYNVSIQGVNAFCTQGAGIVIPFKKYFKTDKFPMELSGRGDINKLGQIDCKDFYLKDGEVFTENDSTINMKRITICNCYSQFHYGMNHLDGSYKPADYEALTLCLRKINYKFNGLRIVTPLICGGLAGGDPELIKLIIKKELKDCDVTLVLFNK